MAQKSGSELTDKVTTAFYPLIYLLTFLTKTSTISPTVIIASAIIITVTISKLLPDLYKVMIFRFYSHVYVVFPVHIHINNTYFIF